MKLKDIKVGMFVKVVSAEAGGGSTGNIRKCFCIKSVEERGACILPASYIHRDDIEPVEVAVKTPTEEEYNRLMQAYEKVGWATANYWFTNKEETACCFEESQSKNFGRLEGVLKKKGYHFITVDEAIESLKLQFPDIDSKETVSEKKFKVGDRVWKLDSKSIGQARDMLNKTRRRQLDYYKYNLTPNLMGVDETCCEHPKLSSLKDKVRGLSPTVRRRRDYGIESSDGTPTEAGLELAMEMVYKDRVVEIDAHLKSLEAKKK